MIEFLLLILGPIALAFYVAARGRGTYGRLALHSATAAGICLASPLVVAGLVGGRMSDGAGVMMGIMAFINWPVAALFAFFAVLNGLFAAVIRLTPVRDAD